MRGKDLYFLPILILTLSLFWAQNAVGEVSSGGPTMSEDTLVNILSRVDVKRLSEDEKRVLREAAKAIDLRQKLQEQTEGLEIWVVRRLLGRADFDKIPPSELETLALAVREAEEKASGLDRVRVKALENLIMLAERRFIPPVQVTLRKSAEEEAIAKLEKLEVPVLAKQEKATAPEPPQQVSVGRLRIQPAPGMASVRQPVEARPHAPYAGEPLRMELPPGRPYQPDVAAGYAPVAVRSVMPSYEEPLHGMAGASMIQPGITHPSFYIPPAGQEAYDIRPMGQLMAEAEMDILAREYARNPALRPPIQDVRFNPDPLKPLPDEPEPRPADPSRHAILNTPRLQLKDEDEGGASLARLPVPQGAGPDPDEDSVSFAGYLEDQFARNEIEPVPTIAEMKTREAALILEAEAEVIRAATSEGEMVVQSVIEQERAEAEAVASESSHEEAEEWEKEEDRSKPSPFLSEGDVESETMEVAREVSQSEVEEESPQEEPAAEVEPVKEPEAIREDEAMVVIPLPEKEEPAAEVEPVKEPEEIREDEAMVVIPLPEKEEPAAEVEIEIVETEAVEEIPESHHTGEHEESLSVEEHHASAEDIPLPENGHAEEVEKTVVAHEEPESRHEEALPQESGEPGTVAHEPSHQPEVVEVETETREVAEEAHAVEPEKQEPTPAIEVEVVQAGVVEFHEQEEPEVEEPSEPRVEDRSVAEASPRIEIEPEVTESHREGPTAEEIQRIFEKEINRRTLAMKENAEKKQESSAPEKELSHEEESEAEEAAPTLSGEEQRKAQLIKEAYEREINLRILSQTAEEPVQPPAEEEEPAVEEAPAPEAPSGEASVIAEAVIEQDRMAAASAEVESQMQEEPAPESPSPEASVEEEPSAEDIAQAREWLDQMEVRLARSSVFGEVAQQAPDVPEHQVRKAVEEAGSRGTPVLTPAPLLLADFTISKLSKRLRLQDDSGAILREWDAGVLHEGVKIDGVEMLLSYGYERRGHFLVMLQAPPRLEKPVQFEVMGQPVAMTARALLTIVLKRDLNVLVFTAGPIGEVEVAGRKLDLDKGLTLVNPSAYRSADESAPSPNKAGSVLLR